MTIFDYVGDDGLWRCVPRSSLQRTASTGRLLTAKNMQPAEFRQVRDLIEQKVKDILHGYNFMIFAS